MSAKPHYIRIENSESAGATQMADTLVQGRVSAFAREPLCKGQTKKSVSRVEITCLFDVLEPEPEAVVVPVEPMAAILSFDPGSAESA